MLRRKPTPIKLTADDVLIYEEFRREMDERSGGGGVKEENAGQGGKGRKGVVAGREERIGIGSAAGGMGMGMGIGGGGGGGGGRN